MGSTRPRSRTTQASRVAQVARDPSRARPRQRATWAKRCVRPKQRAAQVARDGLGSSGFFFFFFLPSLICYDMFWAFVILICKIRVRKSSLRDSISMWSPCGKICHIGQYQSMEIESQRLDL